MRPGGTLDTRVLQNDLNDIQSGLFYAPTLLHLPLKVGFSQGVDNPSVDGYTAAYGGRPDGQTGSGSNPILGNMLKGAAGQILPERIQLSQPCNSIQLIWHCLDPEGNYDCSYPINSALNTTTKTWPLTGAASVAQHWACGWLRANGIGPWLPMSLLPSTDWTGATMTAFPFGGFSAIAGAMSFIDWIGYWDGAGAINVGPRGPNAYILALASANSSYSSNRSSMGQLSNYAIPSGSGPQDASSPADTVRSKDVLVKAGSNGRS